MNNLENYGFKFNKKEKMNLKDAVEVEFKNNRIDILQYTEFILLWERYYE